MTHLANSVEVLAALFVGQPDSAMGLPWVFREYDIDGVRFAALQTAQELRELAIKIALESTPPTDVQRIVAQYHASYRDLKAVLLGVSDLDLNRSPFEGEWHLRGTIEHIMRIAVSYNAVIGYARQRYQNNSLPPRMSELDFNQVCEQNLAPYSLSRGEHIDGGLVDLLQCFDNLQQHIIDSMLSIPDSELSVGSMWWESYAQSIRFRLHRFEAHMRQHTIQVEKILAAIGYQVTEGRLLVRGMYNALGEVEGVLIGADISADSQKLTAEQISARAQEVAAVFSNNS